MSFNPLPLSLATTGGAINTTTKADLISILTGDIQIPLQAPDDDKRTYVIIDGHSLIQALAKPSGYHTFGENYASVFVGAVTQHLGRNTTRVDMVFDRYIEGVNQSRHQIKTSREEKACPKDHRYSQCSLPYV